MAQLWMQFTRIKAKDFVYCDGLQKNIQPPILDPKYSKYLDLIKYGAKPIKANHVKKNMSY